MSEDAASRYDVLPYESRFIAPTHPDRMATMAVLHGLTPPPVESCRVLELGCADGGNLFPIAQSLPKATFVGIDASPRQIETGRAAAKEMGFDGVDLRVLDIAAADESLGTFDYIIAHGVYSWVAAPVREKVLQICRDNLAPNGVAYVSYNTYPGWHLRGMTREMMQFHTRGMDDPQRQVAESRALLNFLSLASVPTEGAYAGVLREEAARLEKHRDAYIFHEHLEPENHAVWFHEFVGHAARSGLHYLGPSQFNILETAFPPETREVLGRLGSDRVRYEQYVDFLLSRAFRQSLLCHPGREAREGATVEAIPKLRITAMARAVSGRIDVTSEAPEPFVSIHGDQLTVGRPILKAALLTLFENHPRSFSFDELHSTALRRLGRTAPHADEDRESFASYVLQAHVTNLLDLHTYDPPIDDAPADRPRAGAYIRRQAASGARVVGLRSRYANVQDLDRLVLPLADGQNNRDAMLDALVAAMNAGKFQMQRDGQDLTDPQEIRTVLRQSLDDCLHRMAGEGVFLAD